MNYTFDTKTGDGVTTAFTFGFAGPDEGYIDLRRDLRVYVNGVSTSFTTSFSDPNKVFITPAPALGAVILIRRIMPRTEPYSDFKGSNAFTPQQLNFTSLQQLYLTQELLDGFYDPDFYLKQDLNMGNHKITNLSDGTNPNDATNLGQLTEVEEDLAAIDQKHTVWNQSQDADIKSLQLGLAASGASTSIPWAYIATGGEVDIKPPYTFRSAHVFRNGVRQYEVLSACYVVDSHILFDEPLLVGEQVMVDIGANYNPSSAHLSGNTASRPTGVYIGYQYFDTTLGHPVYWQGINWVNAMGLTV